MNKRSINTINYITIKMQMFDILIRHNVIKKDQIYELEDGEIEKMFYELYDLKLDEAQSQVIMELLSPISTAKDYHKYIIERTERTMKESLELINNSKAKNKKTEKEIKKIKRTIIKYWKDVKKADYSVMDSTNSLLKSIQVKDIFNDDQNKIKEYQKINNQIGCFSFFDNMGFSSEDGYSESPSGKVDTILQIEVFNLITSLLDLHSKITVFLFYQAELYNTLFQDSMTRNKKLYDYFSKSFLQIIPRKRCFELIIEVFNDKDFYGYSESYILKQLSNWNTNKTSIAKTKKRKMLALINGYENARRGTEDDFKKWVSSSYLPYHISKRNKRHIVQKKSAVYDDEKQYTNSLKDRSKKDRDKDK